MGWLLKEVCPPQVPMKHSFPGSWELASIPTLFQKRTRKKKKKKKQHLVHPLPHSLTGPHMGNGIPFDLITPMILGVHVQMAYSCALLKVKVLILNKGERVPVFFSPCQVAEAALMFCWDCLVKAAWQISWLS